jgi:choline kinase
LKKHHVQDEEIKVKVDENGRVLEIGKEVKLQDAIGESIGIEKFGVETLKQLFTIIERKIVVEKKVNQFYEAAFQELADKGANIYTVDTTDYICMEIDTAADLEAARLILLKQH